MADTCKAPGGEEMFTINFFGLGSKRSAILLALVIGVTPLFVLLVGPKLFGYLGRSLGSSLEKKASTRKDEILKKVEEDERAFTATSEKRRNSDDWENVESYATGSAKNGDKAEEEWQGIVGFFHPFCNAGGGGERVLWAAIRATQMRWPNAKVVVYTGDRDVDKAAILSRVENRFNIQLHPPTITFLFLTTRHWVLASTWPRFTLLGQSIGSLILAWDAFSLLKPDIFVDTMGYAFASGLSKFLFPDMPTGSYVHYPTISTDMLGSLDATSPLGDKGVNAGKGSGTRGAVKKLYWDLFAKLYSFVGCTIDVVVANSTWTKNHLQSLWGPWRREFNKSRIGVLYPPVAVEELEREVEVSEASEKNRQNILLYIAQFRPEKNHKLILTAFSEFMATKTAATKNTKLVLIGSVRDDADSKRVYELRLLANELHVKDTVEFHLDASWPEILDWLRIASVGVNGMWNEHFGIGVVEYQAAGLISVVHDSGGPKIDIVTSVDGGPTGFHASTTAEFAKGYEDALSLEDKLAMRLRARLSAKRFTEEEFAKGWIQVMQRLVSLHSSSSH